MKLQEIRGLNTSSFGGGLGALIPRQVKVIETKLVQDEVLAKRGIYVNHLGQFYTTITENEKANEVNQDKQATALSGSWTPWNPKSSKPVPEGLFWVQLRAGAIRRSNDIMTWYDDYVYDEVQVVAYRPLIRTFDIGARAKVWKKGDHLNKTGFINKVFDHSRQFCLEDIGACFYSSELQIILD